MRAQYVTPPREDKLIEAAINGMLTSLDPHSSYMNAKDAEDMRAQTRGEFGGLGIEVTMDNDLVKVITPIDDTPAAKAGVLAGDYIAAIDGQVSARPEAGRRRRKMRGAVKTPIKLTLLRKGADKPIELTIIRDVIAVAAVKSASKKAVTSAISASSPSPKRPTPTSKRRSPRSRRIFRPIS